jgi:phosphoribosylamine--glycine ligase
VVSDAVHRRILDEVIHPTLAGMAAEGNSYRGFLYAGLMIDASGAPKVIEFNCRFGDPETQPIMLRLQSDLVALCRAAIDGTLGGQDTEWDPRPALGVVLAAAGYPGSYDRGTAITALPAEQEDLKVFHAGTALQDGQTVTSGGRVLCVTALGEDIRAARARCYEGVAGVAFEGMQYRRDIGWRALDRYSQGES